MLSACAPILENKPTSLHPIFAKVKMVIETKSLHKFFAKVKMVIESVFLHAIFAEVEMVIENVFFVSNRFLFFMCVQKCWGLKTVPKGPQGMFLNHD